MWGRLVVACVLTVSSFTVGHAAPAADLVVAWSPSRLGPLADAIADAASRAGASFSDASPEAIALPDPRPLIKRGISAYGMLEFDAALTALDAAAEIVDQTGASAVDTATLADLFLHRALTHAQRADDARAWDDFVVSAGIAPTRILDPAAFPPRAIERFEQARAQVATLPRGRARLVGPGRCEVRVDGTVMTTPEIELPFGRHWLDATCEGRVAVRRRLVVDRTDFDVTLGGAEIAPPTDAAYLVHARTAGARAVVAVTILGQTALVRRLGIDGTEQDRTSVALRGVRHGRDVADAVARLLTPPVVVRAQPWYRSPWLWAAAGALAASAILIPIAANRGGDVPEVVVRPEGVRW